MTFIRTKENFVCEHCSREVLGNGFTNHCPECLWSRHVDIDPGDRAEICGGMMVPIKAEESGGEWSLIQRCQKCGFERKNKVSPGDNFEEVVKLSIG